MVRGLLTFALALLSTPAIAWDGTVIGRIVQLDVARSDTYATRIILVNGPPLCGGAYSWAYVNLSDTNYQAFVAQLLTAQAMNRTITVYSDRDAGTNYCRIGYVALQTP